MTAVHKTSFPPSISIGPSVMSGAIQLLSHVELLPPDAVGTLGFGPDGVILIERGKICWAVASGMTRTLSRLLREQRSPPLDQAYLERLLRDCESSGKAMAETLLATGQVSEDGLRAALFGHIAEAVARIVSSGAQSDGFAPQGGPSYDPRFVFSTADVLAALGARANRALAVASRRALSSVLVPDTRGLAFVRGDLGPMAVAIEGRPAFRVSEVVELCNWASGMFDVVGLFDAGVRIVSGTTSESNAVVAWRTPELHFMAVCATRAAAARVMARVDTSPQTGREATP